MTEERMIEILNNLKKDIDEISSRFSSIISNANMTIDTTIDDVRALPNYIETLEENLQNLQSAVKDLDEKIMVTKQSIDTVTTDKEIALANKSDLEETETNKRKQKNDLETKIQEYQVKKTQLEAKLDELMASQGRKEEDYKRLEITSKKEIDTIDQKITEMNSKLEQAKQENKLIVYLMESGILDVPEAEIVSVVSADPNGLTLAQIKEKVNMPPVRVQPTINTLLEKVLEHNPQTDTYRILESIKSKLS